MADSEKKKRLPVGIENFEEIRAEGFYYVDKTAMIGDLLHNWGKVNLFTRPRRFGKSLNMSMLKAFFEIGCQKPLFDGLAIARETQLCREYMGRFPVVSVSLKSVEADSYEAARSMVVKVINKEAKRLKSLLDCETLSPDDREMLSSLMSSDMDDATRYRFGNVDVYCPWDVICYVDDLCQNPEAYPQEYWMNTSGNDIIHTFLSKAKPATVKRQIERLMDGEAVTMTIQDKLTYKEMYDSIENMWSVLFMTGYLTQRGKAQGRKRQLMIPNTEIRNIFSEQILEQFFENERQDGREKLYSAASGKGM